MTKMNLTTLLLLSTAIVSLSIFPAVAEESPVSDFDELKKAVEEAEQGQKKEIEVSGEVKFTSGLEIGKKEEKKNVEITVKSGETTATLDGQGQFARGFTIYDGSTLTLKNLNVQKFYKEASGGVYDGAVLVLQGATFNVEANNANVTFSDNVAANYSGSTRNPGYDVEMNGGTMNVGGTGGTVSFLTGISGSGTINHGSENTEDNNTSKMVLGSTNGRFYGTFNNYSGDVEVKKGASFFDGTSTFKKGTLYWNTDKDLGTKAHLNLENGSKLEVGDNAKLTLSSDTKENSTEKDGNSNINENVEITVKENGTLTLKNKRNKSAQTLKKGIKGSGTLDLQSTKLTLDGAGFENKDFKLTSKDSTLTLKNIKETNDKSLDVVANSADKQTGLHLALNGYAGSKNESELVVDGDHITDLLLEGTNTLGNVKLDFTSTDKFGKLTNNGTATLGQVTNNGEINNHGSFTAEQLINGKDAKFTGNGSSSLELGSLQNNGKMDVSASSGKFHVKKFTNGESDQYKEDAEIKGQSLTVDVWQSNHGKLNLTGDLKVEDPDSEDPAANPLSNAGIIEVGGNLEAGKVTVENQGKITVKGTAKTGEVDNQGTFDVTGNLTTTGEVKNENDATLKFAEGTIEGNLTNNGTLTSTGALTVSGESLTNAGNMTVGGDLNAKNVKVENKENSITVSGKAETAEIDNNGTIDITGELTATDEVKNGDNATLKFAGGTISGNVTNSGTVTTSSTTTVNGTTTTNGGTWTNSGALTFAEAVSGTGTFTNNNGNMTLNGDASGFTGTFTQSGGTTTVNGESAKMFKGTNNINGGTLDVTSESLDYKVSLGSGAKWNHTGQGGEIKEETLNFSGSNAEATLKGKGAESSTYTLSSAVTKDNNKITFGNTTLKLDGQEFKNLTLDSVTLDLHDENDGKLEAKDYTFSNAMLKGTNKLDFDVLLLKPTDGQYKFDSDTITFTGTNNGQSWTNWHLGKIYIGGDEVYAPQQTYTGDDILKREGGGAGTTFSPETVTVATNYFTYDVKTSGGSITVTQQQGVTSDDPLAKMNEDIEGTRKYVLSGNSDEDHAYHNHNSLDHMKEGDLSVYGEHKDPAQDVLSGQLMDENKKLKSEYGSLFDLENGNVNLDVSDLTITDAQRKVTGGDKDNGGGSVLRNNNDHARVDMSNLKIVGNSSTSTNGEETKGGAIYNNGGEGENEAGLHLSQVTFEGNTAGDDEKVGKGGAVYNDEKGVVYLKDVTTTASAAEPEPATKRVARSADLDESTLGHNDIYNVGTVYTSGTNNFGTLFTNDKDGDEGSEKKGQVHFGGYDTLAEIVNNGDITNDAGTLTITGKASGTGTLKNSAELNLQGDVSGLTGDFTQTGGITEVKGKFFGGKSEITGGGFVWNSQEDKLWDDTEEKAGERKLTVSGDATFQLGENKKLTLGENAEVNSKVNVLSGSTLTVSGEGENKGKLTLKEGSYWDGTIDVEGGEFTVSATDGTQTKNSVLKANSGSVTIGDNGKLLLNSGSEIKDDVKTNIGNGATVVVENGGTLSLNSGDTVNGTTFLNGGTLDYGESVSVGENATLQAFNGSLNVKEKAKLTLASEESVIYDEVKLDIDKSASVELKKGKLRIGNEDQWLGSIILDGGSLFYDTKKNGNLTATSGNLTLLDGSEMIIGKEGEAGKEGKTESGTSKVDEAVALDIQKGAKLNVLKDATFTLDSQDQWHGTIQNEGGTVTLSGLTGIGGKFEQDSGSVTFNKKTDLWLDGDNFNVKNGSIGLDDSQLRFYNTTDLTFTDLSMSNSTLGFKNGAPQKVTLDKLKLTGDDNHFSFDIDLSGGQSDQIEIKQKEGSNGTLDVSEFGIVGSVPNDKSVDVELFTGENLDDLTFSASADQVRSALGYYDLTALDEKGWYRATLSVYNPNVYRGQVAAVAMLYNQLGVDDMVLHHLILDHAGTVPHESSIAKTRRFNQAVRDGRGANVWVKPYYDGGKLSLSEGLDVDNNSYGLIAGADMPMGTFDNGWQYVPTFYVAYNGADQSYEDVDMKQNGGQAGFMTTFMKNNFVAAANVYGGAYQNEMDVENFTDKTDGWFAGVSARAAYNAKLNTNLTLQPALFASYNMFSKQDWDSDFGDMALEADALNGYNVAPELNLIYTQNDWSVYGMLQYMFTFDQDVQGKADESDLPDIGMDGDYVQYGAGVAKIWNKALSTNFQIIGRSGSRTDVGVRLGVQYMFN